MSRNRGQYNRSRKALLRRRQEEEEASKRRNTISPERRDALNAATAARNEAMELAAAEPADATV